MCSLVNQEIFKQIMKTNCFLQYYHKVRYLANKNIILSKKNKSGNESPDFTFHFTSKTMDLTFVIASMLYLIP